MDVNHDWQLIIGLVLSAYFDWMQYYIESLQFFYISSQES